MSLEKEKIEFSARLGRWVLAHKFIVVMISLISIGALGYGAKNITLNSDYRYFFGADNPQRLAFESFQKIYAKDDSALIVIESNTGTIFNKQTLLALKDLTDQAWEVPFSTRVNSLANYQHTEAIEDDLMVRDLIGGVGSPKLSDDYIKKIRQISTTEPLLVNSIVNPTGTMTAVSILVTMPQKSTRETPAVVAHVKDMVEKWKIKYPGHNVYLSGMVFMNNAFNVAAKKDMLLLIPIMYLIILVIMFFLLRTVFGVLNTFFIIILSVLGAMGVSGWMGIPITPPSSMAPTVILTLAIADSVHILKAIIGYLKKGFSKEDAIVEGLRVNLQPVFLTSLTTVIGFLSLNFSDTPPFHDLGNITAIGVSIAFFLSVTLLPVLTAIFPISVGSDISKAPFKFYRSLGNWVMLRKVPIALFVTFCTVFLGMQIPKIKLNDQYINYFDKSIQFRKDTEYIANHLSGIYQINFDIRSGESQGIAHPVFLRHVDNFVNYAKSMEEVEHVNTITDTFKRLNKSMHGDDESYYKLPENRELSAQYLLMYEMSLPYGLDLNNQIDIDKAGTRVMVTLKNLDTEDFLKINDRLERWLIDNTPTKMHAVGTSPAVMFSHITERNVKSMAWGTLLAFLLISTVLGFSLGSVRYGLISLLPNIVPALMAFGIWSLTVGEAGFAIAVVTSLTLGVVVDDTVHFLSKYVRARKEKGLNPEEAIGDALENVGTALLATTIILTIGFSILMFSTFLMNWTLGALSAMTIFIALLVDFTFLPSILILFDKKKVMASGSNVNIDEKGENMNIKKVCILILVIGCAAGFSKLAKSSEDVLRGLEIAHLIDKNDQGWDNQIANVEMVLRNKQGQKSVRKMKIKTLEVKGDGDKSLTIFKSPKDVKGTAFLSFSHSIASDDQWLYLPALKRVKRISSHNKSGPFMGSEFAYEDISSQEVEKYTYKFIKKMEVAGHPGYQVERYPEYPNSGYTKQVFWVDSKEYRIHKIDFYDRKKSKRKTLEFKGFKKYLTNTWRPSIMSMVNLQNGKSTELIWTGYKFKTGINTRDFDKNALKRVR